MKCAENLYRKMLNVVCRVKFGLTWLILRFQRSLHGLSRTEEIFERRMNLKRVKKAGGEFECWKKWCGILNSKNSRSLVSRIVKLELLYCRQCCYGRNLDKANLTSQQNYLEQIWIQWTVYLMSSQRQTLRNHLCQLSGNRLCCSSDEGLKYKHTEKWTKQNL